MVFRKLFEKPAKERTFRRKDSKTEFRTTGDGYTIYQRMMDFECQISNSVYVGGWVEIIDGEEFPAVEDKYIHIR